jgi:hypothetical protein
MLSTTHLKLCMFLYVICPHAIENELCLVGHPHNMIPGGMGEQAAFVHQLDERQARMLLQGVLPFLRAQQHHQLHHRGALLQGHQAWNKSISNIPLLH